MKFELEEGYAEAQSKDLLDVGYCVRICIKCAIKRPVLCLVARDRSSFRVMPFLGCKRSMERRVGPSTAARSNFAKRQDVMLAFAQDDGLLKFEIDYNLRATIAQFGVLRVAADVIVIFPAADAFFHAVIFRARDGDAFFGFGRSDDNF